MSIAIEQVQLHSGAFSAYWRLRGVLWPMDDAQWEREAIGVMENPRWEVFVARSGGGVVVGFLEVSLRDYAEGAETSPVGFLEGSYVEANYRRQGVAAALVQAGEQWAWSRGCTEVASGALIDNAEYRDAWAVGLYGGGAAGLFFEEEVKAGCGWLVTGGGYS